MAKNIISQIQSWKLTNTSGLLSSKITYVDNYSCTYQCCKEGDYIYTELSSSTGIAGHSLKLTFNKFSSSDSDAWLCIRIYTTSDQYTQIDYKEADGQLGENILLYIDIPQEFYKLQIRCRHEYARDLSEADNVIITVTNVSLIDTYVISQTTLNFHKVLAENLPTSVEPGTQHIYFVSDGSTVTQYIATKEGNLLPVGVTGSTSSEESSYTNTYTQEWIDERKDEIESLTKEGHCFVFAVATDIHVRIEDGDANRYNRVRDLIMISKQLPIDYICCCGDIMSYCQDWSIYEPRIEKIKNIFNQCRCPWFATRGNHDYNSDDYNPSGNTNILEFNIDTANDLFVRNNDWYKSITASYKDNSSIKIVFDEGREQYGYFYVDDYAHKHRMIFTNSEETHENRYGKPFVNDDGVLDCFVSGSCETKHQIEWLINKAMDMTDKTDWCVSFYSHTVPYTDAAEEDKSEFHGYGGDNAELRSIVYAFQHGEDITDLSYGCLNADTHAWISLKINKTFSTQGPIQVVGWFGGHCHDDCYKKVNDLNIDISTCTCSERRSSWSNDKTPTKLPPERNSTNYAMSLNVFVVNRDTRTVNMIKLGSKRDNTVKTSSDLTFTY